MNKIVKSTGVLSLIFVIIYKFVRRPALQNTTMAKANVTLKTAEQLKQEYQEIMKDFRPPIQFPKTSHWFNPDRFIKKYSLYHETPNRITSTHTCIIK